MTIQEFINNSSCSKEIKKGGLPYLVDSWRNIVNKIPYDKNYCIYSYMNDLDARRIIYDIDSNCRIPENFLEEIKVFDFLFKEKTIEVAECVYGSEKFKKLYDNVRHWFYYRLPPERIPDWYNEKSTEMKMWKEWKDLCTTKI
jgi:hypothetical protein